ncbi:unnamed protein product [Pleuronectes platessa]|uniref:Uncharacterized protein n=1 Tax=Pleuronectes platessa TaxID=8262 RepID=A0A9N7TPN2_PLEPL|nr:unnamed protein product [Pleuronectes platessa]
MFSTSAGANRCSRRDRIWERSDSLEKEQEPCLVDDCGNESLLLSGLLHISKHFSSRSVACGSVGELEPSQLLGEGHQRMAGLTHRGKQPTTTFTPMLNLESPNNLCMSLDCGRKLENLEKNPHRHEGSTRTLHCEATVSTTETLTTILEPAFTLDLMKHSGPTPAADMAPQTITDCGNFTLDFKQLGFCSSPAFLQTLAP